AESDELALLVRDLDTDRAAPGDRRQDADVGRRHRVRDVVSEARDAVHLHARLELELVARHRGSDRHPDEVRGDAVLVQRALEDLATFLHDARVGALAVATLQEVGRRQLPVARRLRGAEVERGLVTRRRVDDRYLDAGHAGGGVDRLARGRTRRRGIAL